MPGILQAHIHLRPSQSMHECAHFTGEPGGPPGAGNRASATGVRGPWNPSGGPAICTQGGVQPRPPFHKRQGRRGAHCVCLAGCVATYATGTPSHGRKLLSGFRGGQEDSAIVAGVGVIGWSGCLYSPHQHQNQGTGRDWHRSRWLSPSARALVAVAKHACTCVLHRRATRSWCPHRGRRLHSSQRLHRTQRPHKSRRLPRSQHWGTSWRPRPSR